ncbi:MAG: HAD-IA family hydrolase [Bacteroidota bacterium]
MKKELLVFDFDGTIADTLSVAVEISNELAPEFDFPKMNTEEFLELKGKKVAELMEMANMSWVKLPVFIKRVRDSFKKYLPQVEPVEGMPEVLLALKSEGFHMGILTSNTEENVHHFLQQHQLEYFEFIHSPSSIFGKGRVLKTFSRKYKIPNRKVVMIGDERRDIKAAHKAEVRSVGVTWGFGSADALQEHEPHHIVHQPKELFKLFTGKNLADVRG